MSFLKLVVPFDRKYYNTLSVPVANRILRNGHFDSNGLSNTKKLSMKSWSIPPSACITGKILSLMPDSICAQCYAKRGNYNYREPKDAMAQRLDAWREQEYWLEAITFLIRTTEPSKMFRWFDAGDMQEEYMMLQIIKVANELSDFKFWLPTHEIEMVENIVKQGYIIPRNLKILLSSSYINGAPPLEKAKELSKYPNVHRKIGTTVVLKTKEFEEYHGFKCPASKQNNKCLDCTVCTTSDLDIIAYKKK